MKKFYLLSLKHTSQKDSVFTFWRPNERGYCWFKVWAGLFGEHEAKTIAERGTAIAIPEEVADRHFVNALYEGIVRQVVPIDWESLQAFGLVRSDLYGHAKTTYGIEIITDEGKPKTEK